MYRTLDATYVKCTRDFCADRVGTVFGKIEGCSRFLLTVVRCQTRILRTYLDYDFMYSISSSIPPRLGACASAMTKLRVLHVLWQ